MLILFNIVLIYYLAFLNFIALDIPPVLKFRVWQSWNAFSTAYLHFFTDIIQSFICFPVSNLSSKIINVSRKTRRTTDTDIWKIISNFKQYFEHYELPQSVQHNNKTLMCFCSMLNNVKQNCAFVYWAWGFSDKWKLLICFENRLKRETLDH